MTAETIKTNACICGAFVLMLYMLYGFGSWQSTGVWPDGPIFTGMVAVMLSLFGIGNYKLIQQAKALDVKAPVKDEEE